MNTRVPSDSRAKLILLIHSSYHAYRVCICIYKYSLVCLVKETTCTVLCHLLVYLCSKWHVLASQIKEMCVAR